MSRPLAALLTFGAWSLCAQPSITQPLISPGGIVNAASLIAPGLPGGAIARGSLFSLFGRRVGPTAGVSASAFPLQTALAGVSIKITQGSNSVDAIPVFVSANQINAIMPSNAPLGMSSVVVTANNARSFAYPVQVVNSSPGIFAVTSAGIGPGVFQNFVAPDDQPVNSLVTSARRGQAITMWATGLGPVNYADTISPAAGNLPTPVEVFVGGKLANTLYSGRAPCCSSTDQIVFEVPPDAPLGCWVPVMVRTEGKMSSNVATMAISQDGGACGEPANALANQLLGSGKLGVLGFLKVNEVHTLGRRRVEATTDYSSFSFRQEAATAFSFNPLVALPPAGSCTVYSGTLDRFRGVNAMFTDPAGKYLDGGTGFSMIAPRASRSIQVPKASPFFIGGLGTNVAGYALPNYKPPLIDPGNYTFSSTGGSDVGPVRAAFSVASPLTWTNREQLGRVIRSQGLTVRWSGAPAGQMVLIYGHNIDVRTNTKAVFVCTAEGTAAGAFTVPPPILGALPVSSGILSRGLVYVGTVPVAAPPTFTATGLDLGAVIPLQVSAKDVRFQ